MNWLLLGGNGEITARVLYIIIGLAAVYELLTHKKTCSLCDKIGSGTKSEGTETNMGGGMDSSI